MSFRVLLWSYAQNKHQSNKTPTVPFPGQPAFFMSKNFCYGVTSKITPLPLVPPYLVVP